MKRMTQNDVNIFYILTYYQIEFTSMSLYFISQASEFYTISLRVALFSSLIRIICYLTMSTNVSEILAITWKVEMVGENK